MGDRTGAELRITRLPFARTQLSAYLYPLRYPYAWVEGWKGSTMYVLMYNSYDHKMCT